MQYVPGVFLHDEQGSGDGTAAIVQIIGGGKIDLGVCFSPVRKRNFFDG
jgi:hypothetical protein